MSVKPKKSRSPRFVSLRIKLIIGFTLLFSLVFAAAFFWFYTFGTQIAMNRIQADLVSTLQAGIAGIDANEFEQLVKETKAGPDGLPVDSPLYDKHQAWLDTIRRIEPRATPYTFVPDNRPGHPYEVLWVGDIFRIIRPSDQTTWLEPYDAGPTTTKLFFGLADLTINMNPYTDDWGSWVSAYAPIRNSEGVAIGGMGIDLQADYVYEVQASIRRLVLPVFAVVYVVLFILVWGFSSAITRSIAKLTTVAERIGEGDYEQDLTGLIRYRVADEITTMALVLQIMVGKVRAREEKLKQQVAELKIEIDEAKRQQQVSEIVDSDFFQNLQAKAREARGRRAGSRSGGLGGKA